MKFTLFNSLFYGQNHIFKFEEYILEPANKQYLFNFLLKHKHKDDEYSKTIVLYISTEEIKRKYFFYFNKIFFRD